MLHSAKLLYVSVANLVWFAVAVWNILRFSDTAIYF